MALFLSSSAQMDDELMLEAGIIAVELGEENATVYLNFENGKSEPARRELVRTYCNWLPVRTKSRNMELSYSRGVILLRFSLAA